MISVSHSPPPPPPVFGGLLAGLSGLGSAAAKKES